MRGAAHKGTKFRPHFNLPLFARREGKERIRGEIFGGLEMRIVDDSVGFLGVDCNTSCIELLGSETGSMMEKFA